MLPAALLLAAMVRKQRPAFLTRMYRAGRTYWALPCLGATLLIAVIPASLPDGLQQTLATAATAVRRAVDVEDRIEQRRIL